MSKKRHWRLLNVNSHYTNGKDPVPTCCLLACLDALLSRHTLRWSDWLIWPINHQHRQMVYPISKQYFRPLPKTLQRSDSRWTCWANANHSIWRSQANDAQPMPFTTPVPPPHAPDAGRQPLRRQPSAPPRPLLPEWPTLTEVLIAALSTIEKMRGSALEMSQGKSRKIS